MLLCRSCGEGCRRSDDNMEASPTQMLKQKLKRAFLADQQNKWLKRNVESSCLDVCPVPAISVRPMGAEHSQFKSLMWTRDPNQKCDDLIETLKQHLIQFSDPANPRNTSNEKS